MATAYARIFLDAVVPDDQKSSRDLSKYESVLVSGVGESWEAAKAATPIPPGALVSAWATWPI